MTKKRTQRTRLSVVVLIQSVFLLLVVIGGLLSFFGNQGLNRVSTQFASLSQQALPVATLNAEMVEGSLASAQSLTEVINSRTIETLETALNTLKSNEQHVEDAVAELQQLATEHSISWLENDVSAFESDLTTFNQLVSSIQQTQQQILTNQAKLESDKATMNYAVSSVRSEMSRISIGLYAGDTAAMGHVTNFINHSQEMGNNMVALLFESDLKKAEAYAKDLNRTNLSGMLYAWKELNRLNPELAEYSSLSVPFDMVKELFSEQGMVALKLDTLRLIQTQAEKADQAKVQVEKIMLKLGDMETGSQRMIYESEQGVLAASDNAKMIFIALSVAGLLLALLAGAWVSKTVRLSLQRLDDVIKANSVGDLTVIADENAPKEFAELASLLNQSNRTNSHAMAQLSENGHTLTQAAERSQAASAQSRRALSQQSDQLSTIAAAITELEASIKEIAQSTTESETEAEAANTLAQEGAGIIARSTERLQSLDVQFARNEACMISLDEHVGKITEVVELISTIANNTNLLALNAAIEAARAGEQGRGFAVVADEVRKLASETNQQTESIRRTIAELHQAAEEANTAMQESRSEMTASINLSGEVESAIQSIQGAIARITDKVITISAATQQQENASMEVGRSVEEVASQASLNNQQLSTLVEEARTVSDIAREQSQMLTRYKILDPAV
ncbi:methyl-accepting chemotaxis protein [Photobacterium sp. WH77]|uniref:Methyl-accepting chemotaxis protein n=1 Tax=Photobacterium arenosum TaxID=2774143 RepID=A0ABR9BPN3_9GAMM|nr:MULTISPECIES: methyl-accepting chemotaxis protein [Photobacterium]MBD8514528.1 methyl-accepting chemotaxis protein [Photobacterium arenosum]MCG2836280.1 methyl-accepting chemotaxis protein [Photobacterium sp. WH77]MCG2844093.1 methyl-accepting chemotaxis protein [Photobacterium sp. WH80]